MKRIYLDYNATTPVAPSVQEAMQPFFTEHFGNPSSTHALGRACQQALEDARDGVASLLGSQRDEIIFTSGGTESSNLAIIGAVLQRSDRRFSGHVVTTAVEHPATMQPVKFLESMGCDVTVVGCDTRGVVDAAAISGALRDDTVIVSVMHANNEVGTIQPIREIAQICRAHNVILHTDAAQSIGKIRTDVEELGVDLMTVAGHKVYAPKGVGALYVRRSTPIKPVLRGAGHEQGLRPGTENVAFAFALGHACRLAAKGLDENTLRLSMLRDRLYVGLREAIGPELTLHGDDADRLPNTLSVSFPRSSGHELLAKVPEICASTGSACHSGVTSMSATLEAMQVTEEQARGTVRLSVGWNTSEEEIERAVGLLSAAWESSL